jgi:uncharacterized protein YecA (UPF0149 family)
VASTSFPKIKPEQKLVWNSHDWNKLEQAWKEYNKPVRDLEHFAVLVNYEYAVAGDDEEVYSCIEYNNSSEEKIEVSLVSQRDIDEYSELFTVVDKIKPIKKTVLTLSPNSKCSCGSGKKYKRCCMFKD